MAEMIAYTGVCGSAVRYMGKLRPRAKVVMRTNNFNAKFYSK